MLWGTKVWVRIGVLIFIYIGIAGLLVGEPEPQKETAKKRGQPTSALNLPGDPDNLSAVDDKPKSQSAEQVDPPPPSRDDEPTSQSGNGDNRPPSSRNAYRTLRMEATAYGPPDFPKGQTTASGEPVGSGSIAVDPNVIPLGTRLYVEGYGYGIANDTGGVIKGNIVDLWLPSNDRCVNWGRRTVTVDILK